MKRKIARSSLTRTSTSRDCPTVSIQNAAVHEGAQLVRQRSVEQIEKRLGLRGRQVARGQNLERETKLALGEFR